MDIYSNCGNAITDSLQKCDKISAKRERISKYLAPKKQKKQRQPFRNFW